MCLAGRRLQLLSRLIVCKINPTWDLGSTRPCSTLFSVPPVRFNAPVLLHAPATPVSSTAARRNQVLSVPPSPFNHSCPRHPAAQRNRDVADGHGEQVQGRPDDCGLVVSQIRCLAPEQWLLRCVSAAAPVGSSTFTRPATPWLLVLSVLHTPLLQGLRCTPAACRSLHGALAEEHSPVSGNADSVTAFEKGVPGPNGRGAGRLPRTPVKTRECKFIPTRPSCAELVARRSLKLASTRAPCRT